MASLSDVLSNAKAARPETTVHVCLRGDLLAEVKRLETELEVLQGEASRPSNPRDERIGSAGGSLALQRQLAEQIETVRAEMQAASVPFRFRGMSKPQWDALMVKHQPRRDDTVDRNVGFNRAGLFPELVRATLVDPEVGSDDEWQQLLDVLSAGQFEALVSAAYSASAEAVEVPFSAAASVTLQASPGQSV